jgi:aromatic-L-amino-acid decarboxylase
MTPEEFRRYGHAVVDWVADYWSGVGDHPVQSSVAPGDVAGALPAGAPEQGEQVEAMLADLDKIIMPGITHWQHPAFFGFFPANTSGPSLLGDILSGGLNVQGMLWSTSPACTELETVVCDWLARLMGLPEAFRGNGVIQDTASSALLVAVLAALSRAGGADWRERGAGDRYVMYASTQGNSSIPKTARIVGIGDAQLRLVDVDDTTLAMRPDHLRSLIEADRAAGYTPVAVVATIGTTSTTAVDPLPAIGEICREYGVWLHVDAAYAGAAGVCPEFTWINEGVEYADSYCFNPHKWLLTGFDCDVLWIADREAMLRATSLTPAYLRDAASESGQVIDYRDWQVPLGRRFRALKLWFVLRWYGAEGLRAHIRSGVALAQEFASWVRADDRFEVMAPHPLSLVCFRLRAGNDVNAELERRLNATGRLFLSHTEVNGHYTLRLAIGAPTTTHTHVAAAWTQIQTEATHLRRDHAHA